MLPRVETWSPNHWTAREFPGLIYFLTQEFLISIFFKNKFIYFIYLFLAALGLFCCARAFSSCGEQGLHFPAVCGLLIAEDSLAAEHGL